MKKAELKKLKELIKGLPEIPILEDGKPGEIPIHYMGSTLEREGIKRDSQGKPINPKAFYSTGVNNRPKAVNKEKFFLEHMAKGFTAQQTVDLWNEKYKRVQEAIANYVPPVKKPEDEKSVEQLKQELADKVQELDNQRQAKVARRQLAFPRKKRKK